MTKKQKMWLGIGFLAVAGYLVYSKTKKNFAGGTDFFKSHSQNCSGTNCM